jgi:hypothetical protein
VVRIEMFREPSEAAFPAVQVDLQGGQIALLAPVSVNGDVAIYEYPWTLEELPEMRERTFVFNDLDVLFTENAWGGIHLARNLNLSATGSTRVTNPRFVYQTPQVRFVNKVTPLIDSSRAINVATGGLKSLTAHLTDMFNALFGSAVQQNDATPRLIKVGVRYGYDIRGQSGAALGPGQSEQFETYMPILQRMSFTVEPNNMGGFISGLAGSITEWQNALNPSRARAFYEIDLSVFAALSETDLPVLRLRRLWLGLDRIG